MHSRHQRRRELYMDRTSRDRALLRPFVPRYIHSIVLLLSLPVSTYIRLRLTPLRYTHARLTVTTLIDRPTNPSRRRDLPYITPPLVRTVPLASLLRFVTRALRFPAASLRERDKGDRNSSAPIFVRLILHIMEVARRRNLFVRCFCQTPPVTRARDQGGTTGGSHHRCQWRGVASDLLPDISRPTCALLRGRLICRRDRATFCTHREPGREAQPFSSTCLICTDA